MANRGVASDDDDWEGERKIDSDGGWDCLTRLFSLTGINWESSW